MNGNGASREVHAARWEGVPLAEVVTAAAPGGALALLYAFDRCALARFDDGGLREPGGPSDLDGVYEARVFAQPGEIRWVRRGLAGGGTAVWFGEAPPPGAFPDAIQAPAVVGTLDCSYLLWGQVTGNEPASGWSEVAAAQVGAVAVPIPRTPRSRTAHLRAREYLAEDRHGNAYVAEHRLVGLAWDEREGS